RLLTLWFNSTAAHDGFEKKDGILQNLINDDVVIIAIKLDLTFRDLQPAADNISRFQHAHLQPPLELRKRRRQYENCSCVLHFGFHLLCSLDIDVEDHVLAGVQLLMDEYAASTVELAIELRPFYELAALDHT